MLPKLRRVLVSALTIALIVPGVPLFAAPARQVQPESGSISGAARNSSVMPNTTVRLRNVQTGQLAGTTTSDAGGGFSFGSLPPGIYAVEVLNAAGAVVGTSAPILLSASAMSVAGVAVTSTSVLLPAAGAAVGSAFLASTLGVITIAAVAAGVVGVVVASNRADASPAR